MAGGGAAGRLLELRTVMEKLRPLDRYNICVFVCRLCRHFVSRWSVSDIEIVFFCMASPINCCDAASLIASLQVREHCAGYRRERLTGKENVAVHSRRQKPSPP